MASVADVDGVFDKQVRNIQKACRDNAQALQEGTAAKWALPEGWNGNPGDREGLGQALSRVNLNQMAAAAIANPANPGTAGDLVVVATQVDYLANMEMAMRQRYTMSPVRALVHAAAVDQGLGNPAGPFGLSVIDYVSRIARQSKE